jgi:hypothetical protein
VRLGLRFGRRRWLLHARRALHFALYRLRYELAIDEQRNCELEWFVEPRAERPFGEQLAFAERGVGTLIVYLDQRTPAILLPLDDDVQEQLAGRRRDGVTAEVAVHGASQTLAAETRYLRARSRPRELDAGSIVGSQGAPTAKQRRRRKQNTERAMYSKARGRTSVHALVERSRAVLGFST